MRLASQLLYLPRHIYDQEKTLRKQWRILKNVHNEQKLYCWNKREKLLFQMFHKLAHIPNYLFI